MTKRLQRLPGVVLCAWVAGAVLTMSAPALAALPAKIQRARELQAVIFVSVVLDGAIESIEFVGPDLYRVRAEGCSLQVRIEDLPDSPGPGGVRKFTAKADEPVCR